MGYTKGFHVWQMEWPQRQRGAHPVVGVATKAAALHATGLYVVDRNEHLKL
ncbi:hypothetical protein KIN20_021339 [Parelaphostrongylus tenuis]|uniref:Uncharacterized protein n=1 Tax=Parelaphostrongylus tenuis TaxID=148309 RepID=A0AAD5NAP7_PARTN|nr:hypothetical protein KIN20_021339 [Parelaphostrongylus tenuis]